MLDAVARYPAWRCAPRPMPTPWTAAAWPRARCCASGEQPTAIVCVNDIMAVGALRELRERGIRVPQDVSVTGFDNVKLSEFCYPALTTVHMTARYNRASDLGNV